MILFKTFLICCLLLQNLAIAKGRKESDDSWLFYIGAGLVGGLAAPLALPALGFGAAGIAAGSVAAGTQAAIGNVAAGSAFALAQSAGATLGASTIAASGAAGALGGAAVAGAAGKSTRKRRSVRDDDYY